MAGGPTLDWTCSQCGTNQALELIKVDAEAPPDPRAANVARDPRTFDFTCARCGTTETYMLVPAGVSA
jgi:hypothetical protein